MPTPQHTPTQTPEFLPCPFCGEAPTISGVYDTDDGRYYQMHAQCCVHMETGIGWREYQAMPGVLRPVKLREQLLAAWNTRAKSPADAALVAALQGLVDCPITSGSSAHYRDWHKQRGLPDVLEAARAALRAATATE